MIAQFLAVERTAKVRTHLRDFMKVLVVERVVESLYASSGRYRNAKWSICFSAESRT